MVTALKYSLWSCLAQIVLEVCRAYKISYKRSRSLSLFKGGTGRNVCRVWWSHRTRQVPYVTTSYAAIFLTLHNNRQVGKPRYSPDATAFDCYLLTVSFWLFPFDCFLLIIPFWLFPSDCYLLTVSFWLFLLTVSFWLFPFDYFLLTVSFWLFPFDFYFFKNQILL